MWHFVLTASTGRGAHSGADPLWRGFGRCHPEQADSTREQTEFECVPGLNDLLCQRTTPQKMPKQAMTPHTSGNNLDAQVLLLFCVAASHGFVQATHHCLCTVSQLSCIDAALHGFPKVSRGIFAAVYRCSATAQGLHVRCQVSQPAYFTLSKAAVDVVQACVTFLCLRQPSCLCFKYCWSTL